MGWSSYHVPHGTTVKEAAVDYLTESPGWKVLDAAAKGRTVYAVTEAPDGEVSGVVCLTGMRNSEYHNFSIKLVDESMGPYESECPKRLLDLLDERSPNPEGYAKEWRERCRANLARRAEARKIKPGTTIKLAEPLSFTDGVERDTFTLVKGSTFRSADGVLVRVTRWRDRAYSLV